MLKGALYSTGDYRGGWTQSCALYFMLNWHSLLSLYTCMRMQLFIVLDTVLPAIIIIQTVSRQYSFLYHTYATTN